MPLRSLGAISLAVCRIVVYGAGAVGFLGFLILGVVHAAAPGASRLELPLNSVGDVVISSDAVVFCALVPYGRVQAYDGNTGAFLYGWQPRVNGGSFRIWLDDAEQIRVAGARSHAVEIYSQQGELVGSESTDAFEPGSSRCSPESNGRTACIERRLSLFPRVVVRRDAEVAAKAEQSLGIWSLGAPFPAIVFVAGALLLRFAGGWIRSNQG